MYLRPKNVLHKKKDPSQLEFPKRNGTLTPRLINVFGCSGKNGFGDSQSKLGVNITTCCS